MRRAGQGRESRPNRVVCRLAKESTRLFAQVSGASGVVGGARRFPPSPTSGVLARCGPALPSPTSGGPVRAFQSERGVAVDEPPRRSARSSAATRSSGRGERTSTRAPVTGCLNARRSACRNWRRSPKSAPGRAAVLRVADDRVADRLRGARGSGACARSRAARAAASLLGRAALDLEVRASPRAASSVSVEMRVRGRGGRGRSGRRSCPCAPAGGPRPARGTRARSCAPAAARLERPVDLVGLAPRPAAPTCRGRGGGRSPRATGPRRPAARPASACASVPSRCPRRRVHDHAGGLVHDQQVLVLVGDGERRLAALGCGTRIGLVHLDPFAAGAAGGAWARTVPSTSTWPASISALRLRARAQRLRQEAVQALPGRRGGDVKVSHAASSWAVGRVALLDHVEQRQHAERDRHVGHVERRPQRESMKSVTAPRRRRSNRLPSAPPSSRPVGSQASGGRCGGRSRRAGARARPAVSAASSVAAAREQPNATPRVAHVDQVDAGEERVPRRRGRSSCATSALVAWSSAARWR